MSADAVIASIDGALTDYATSQDAMRWAPERVICGGGRPLRIQPRAPAGAVALSVDVGVEQFILAMAEIGRAAHAWFEQLQPAFTAVSRAALKLCAGFAREPDWSHDLSVSFMDSRGKRRHRRYCSLCNPWGNPRPAAGQFAPGPKAARIRRRKR